jgi:hypothetical protein
MRCAVHEAHRGERYIPTAFWRRNLEQRDELKDVVVNGKRDDNIMNLKEIGLESVC